MLRLPGFIGVRELAKMIRIPPKEIAKRVSVKRYRKYYMEYGANKERYRFDHLGHVIVPFELAKKVALEIGGFSEVGFKHTEPNVLHPSGGNEDDDDATTHTTFSAIPDRPTIIKKRTPVVSVMGHIDHGKTSLVDSIRGTTVADTEVGKITQTVNVGEATILYDAENRDENKSDPANPQNHSEEDLHSNNNNTAAATTTATTITTTPTTTKVTFLDTPGHYHFYRMRNTASDLADVALLVVSLEEGCLLQTREAIGIIEEIGLPTIVCLNKMDLVVDSPDRIDIVRKDLREYEALENAPMIPVSAIDKATLTPLLNEIGRMIPNLDLNSSVSCPADGIVLEVLQSVRGRGRTIRVLIKNGTLFSHDKFVCGANYCSVRALIDVNSGRTVESCAPGSVVDVVYSTKSTPSRKKKKFRSTEAPLEMAFHVVSSLAEAKEILEQRVLEQAFSQACIDSPATNDNSDGENSSQTTTAATDDDDNDGESDDDTDNDDDADNDNDTENNEEYDPSLPPFEIIVKADSAGSLACILDTVQDDLPYVHVVHSGIGDVTQTDAAFAKSGSCPIYCFKVGREKSPRKKIAANQPVRMKCFTTISELVDDAKNAAMLLQHKYSEEDV